MAFHTTWAGSSCDRGGREFSQDGSGDCRRTSWAPTLNKTVKGIADAHGQVAVGRNRWGRRGVVDGRVKVEGGFADVAIGLEQADPQPQV